jgi:hypothetical protein
LGNSLNRDEITAVKVGTIGGDRVDLARRVRPANEPRGTPSCRLGSDADDIAIEGRRFALDTDERACDLNYEVVSLMFSDGTQNRNSEARDLGDDLELGDVAFEIGVVHL